MDSASLREFLENTHLNNAEAKRRRLTLYFISYIGGFIMAALAVQNLARGDHYLAFWLGFFSFSVFANAALSHIFKNSNIFLLYRWVCRCGNGGGDHHYRRLQ